MKETLTLDVVKDAKDVKLAVEYQADIITLYLDGKELCSMDYQANFVFFLQKALKQWGFAKEYD